MQTAEFFIETEKGQRIDFSGAVASVSKLDNGKPMVIVNSEKLTVSLDGISEEFASKLRIGSSYRFLGTIKSIWADSYTSQSTVGC